MVPVDTGDRNELEIEIEMNMNRNPAPSKDQVLFLIRRIINELATEPTKTKVTAEQLGLSTIGVEIDAWPEDYGRILGRNTDYLRAMKMICKLISDRSGKSIELSLKRIPENASGEKNNREHDIKANDNWRRDDMRALTEDMFGQIVDGPAYVMVSDGKQGKTAVDVVVGDNVSPATAQWIKAKLQPLYQAIGIKNQRIIAFNLIRDEGMLHQMLNRPTETKRF